ncbi:MAG: hypothetical protein R3C05_24970 [Pirellulaceae bacterium]
MMQLLAMALMLTSSGCNGGVASRDEPNQAELESAGNANQWVDRCKEAYRRAKTYRDAGYVRLAYQLNGQAFEDRAPLSVCYQVPNRLALNAYALRLTSDGRHLQASVADPDTNHFDGQYLWTGVAPKLTLPEIYADPVVAQFARAGLGGPAPQLELLLSNKPLEGWLQAAKSLSIEDDQMVDGHLCKSIVIAMQNLRYVLCIDEQTHIVRRIELPWQAIAPDLASNPYLSDASLTIELAGAKFDEALSDESFAVQTAPMTVPVSELIPPPPEAPHRLVGRQADSFSLREPNGRFVLASDNNDLPANVLLWIADHPSSQQVAVGLQQTIDNLPASISGGVRAAIVMAEPKQDETTGHILRRWGVGLPWIDDTQAVGRDVFQIAEAPCLIVISQTGTIEVHQQRVHDNMMQALPSLLASMQQKQPVGHIAQQNYIARQARYYRSISEGNGLKFPLSRAALLVVSRDSPSMR